MSNKQPEIHFVKLIPEPEEIPLLDEYIFIPLQWATIKFFQFTLILLFFAVVSDLIS